MQALLKKIPTKAILEMVTQGSEAPFHYDHKQPKHYKAKCNEDMHDQNLHYKESANQDYQLFHIKPAYILDNKFHFEAYLQKFFL